MVDSTKACESAYIDVDLVKNSRAKKAVIVGPGSYVTGKFGEKLELQVEIDGKMKIWSPNRACCNSMRLAYGVDTNSWTGKIVALQITTNPQGKVVIAAIPTHGNPGTKTDMTEQQGRVLDKQTATKN